MPPEPSKGNEKLWSVLCHLSGFFGFPFLFPLVVYLVSRGETDAIADQAKEALNFHLSMLLYFLCTIPLFFIGVGFVLAWGLGLIFVVCSIVAAVRTTNGVLYRYPLTIRFVS